MLVFLHATRCGSVIFGSVFSTMLQGKHLQIFDEVKALKLIMFSNLQVFYLANMFFWSSRFLLPSLQLGWFLLSWFWPLLFRYSYSYLPRLFCFLEDWFQMAMDQLDGTIQCMWKIIFSLSNSKRRGAMIWLPIYYASSVGVPCCHCHMDGSFTNSTEVSNPKFFFRTNPQWEIHYQKRKGLNQTNKKCFFMPNYGRLECGTVPNHLYIHSSRSVPSIS